MDFVKLCQEYRIPVAPEGHKHQRSGWVNIACPFCTGNTGFHLGYESSGNGTGFSCFRCGGHGGIKVIASLCRIRYEEARSVIEQYGGLPYAGKLAKKREYKFSTNVTLPTGIIDLQKGAKKYLEERNFDVEYLERVFGLKQTPFLGWLKHRVFIPIFYHGHMISYTCRSYINSDVRYISCNADSEAIPHKDNLYHLDDVPGKKRIVVVEGCTDVWRLGSGAVATFGTKVTASQIKILCQFKNVILLQDLDNAGRTAWASVAARLRFTGTKLVIISPAEISSTAKDAAELTQNEANYLMRSL